MMQLITQRRGKAKQYRPKVLAGFNDKIIVIIKSHKSCQSTLFITPWSSWLLFRAKITWKRKKRKKNNHARNKDKGKEIAQYTFWYSLAEPCMKLHESLVQGLLKTHKWSVEYCRLITSTTARKSARLQTAICLRTPVAFTFWWLLWRL